MIAFLLTKLRGCKHESTSMRSQTDLVVCFNCGSTMRTGEGFEPVWYAPWLWRK